MSEWQTKEVSELIEAVVSLQSQAEAKAFLRDLLTEAELQEFARRWKAARLLWESVPYSQIAAETGLSSTTIARISKWLTKGTGGYQLIIERLYPSSVQHHHRQ